MKTKIFFSITAFLMMNAAFATVLTVSNDVRGGAQHSTINAAYAAAVNGDTLLIEGTANTYSFTGTWAKSLVVIGAGFNARKNFFLPTTLQRASTTDFAIAVNDARFYGISFIGDYTMSVNGNNIVFEDCLITTNNTTPTATGGPLDVGAGINIQFRNCVFGKNNATCLALSASATASVTIFNCIFDGTIVGNSALNTSLVIDHCIFLRTNGGSITGVKNASITNSIFMNFATIADATTSNCNFSNNIARLGTLPPAGNTGLNNLDNTDPNFVTYTLGTNYVATYDVHLQAGSPALTGSNDGTEIGVHGGTTHFSEAGEPLIAPVVRSMNIINPVIAPGGGTLNINVIASKPDDN